LCQQFLICFSSHKLFKCWMRAYPKQTSADNESRWGRIDSYRIDLYVTC
jgi:hypothetical protein